MEGIKVITDWNEKRVCILLLTASLYRSHGLGSCVHWSAGGYEFFKAVAQQFTNLNLTHEGHADVRISNKYGQLSTEQVHQTRTTFNCLAQVDGFLDFVDEQVKLMTLATQLRCRGYATYKKDGIQSMFNEECSYFSVMLAKKTVKIENRAASASVVVDGAAEVKSTHAPPCDATHSTPSQLAPSPSVPLPSTAAASAAAVRDVPSTATNSPLGPLLPPAAGLGAQPKTRSRTRAEAYNATDRRLLSIDDEKHNVLCVEVQSLLQGGFQNGQSYADAFLHCVANHDQLTDCWRALEQLRNLQTNAALRSALRGRSAESSSDVFEPLKKSTSAWDQVSDGLILEDVWGKRIFIRGEADPASVYLFNLDNAAGRLILVALEAFHKFTIEFARLEKMEIIGSAQRYMYEYSHHNGGLYQLYCRARKTTPISSVSVPSVLDQNLWFSWIKDIASKIQEGALTAVGLVLQCSMPDQCSCANLGTGNTGEHQELHIDHHGVKQFLATMLTLEASGQSRNWPTLSGLQVIVAPDWSLGGINMNATNAPGNFIPDLLRSFDEHERHATAVEDGECESDHRARVQHSVNDREWLSSGRLGLTALTPDFVAKYPTAFQARVVRVPPGCMLIFGPYFIHSGFEGARTRPDCGDMNWRFFGYWDVIAPCMHDDQSSTRIAREFGDSLHVTLGVDAIKKWFPFVLNAK